MASEPLLSGDGNVSELGIVSMSIEYRADNFGEVLTVGAGSFEGLWEKKGGRSWTRRGDGKWIVTVVYEGLAAGTVGQESFRVMSMRSEEPIETHPFIQEIKDKYGGWLDEEGKVKFSEFIPESAGNNSPEIGLVGPPRPGTAIERNPMYGFDAYFVKSIVLEHRFTTDQAPTEYTENDDIIVDSTPNTWIQVPPDRNWLRQLEDVNEVRTIGGDDSGVVYEVSVRYLLSRPGGWPPTKYLLEDLS